MGRTKDEMVGIATSGFHKSTVLLKHLQKFQQHHSELDETTRDVQIEECIENLQEFEKMFKALINGIGCMTD